MLLRTRQDTRRRLERFTPRLFRLVRGRGLCDDTSDRPRTCFDLFRVARDGTADHRSTGGYIPRPTFCLGP